MKDSRFCRASLALCVSAILLPLLAACNQGWTGDARAVNKKTSGYYVSEIELEEKTVGTGEIDPFTHQCTASCTTSLGDWNKIDYVFDGSKFDTTLVLPYVSFDTDNIPVYGFDERSEGWTSSYKLTCEYTYDASDEGNMSLHGQFDSNGKAIYPTTDGSSDGLPISSMTVYQYRGKNPLVAPESDYNKDDGRMSRFRFHRLTGNVLGIVDLDQFLLAVDTYSKFAFVYGHITDTENKAGQQVPTEYEPVELHGTGDDAYRPFYEYDPIGYVESDGTVVLYERYKQDMKDATSIDYMPKVHSAEATMAQRNGAGSSTGDIGRSPYYPGLYTTGHNSSGD